MAEIVLKLHKRYLRPKDNGKSEAENLLETEKWLVGRFAAICCNNPEVTEKKDGYKYALDTSNNWWASGIEDGTIKLAYRYGNGPKNGLMMDGVNAIISWNFGEDS